MHAQCHLAEGFCCLFWEHGGGEVQVLPLYTFCSLEEMLG